MKKRLLGYLLMAAAVVCALMPSPWHDGPNMWIAAFLLVAGWIALRIARQETLDERP